MWSLKLLCNWAKMALYWVINSDKPVFIRMNCTTPLATTQSHDLPCLDISQTQQHYFEWSKDRNTIHAYGTLESWKGSFHCHLLCSSDDVCKNPSGKLEPIVVFPRNQLCNRTPNRSCCEANLDCGLYSLSWLHETALWELFLPMDRSRTLCFWCEFLRRKNSWSMSLKYLRTPDLLRLKPGPRRFEPLKWQSFENPMQVSLDWRSQGLRSRRDAGSVVL